MSTKHIRTTADLVRFGAGISIECRNCSTNRLMDGLEIARVCGVKPLHEVEKRLRCERCGVRDAAIYIIPPS